MSQELALKYSSADPEQLLGILPVEEVLEVIKERVTQELEPAIEDKYLWRIEEAEEEASEWEQTAESWECDAVGLYRAIEEAIKLPWDQAIPLLQKAMEEHGSDIN